jgi:carbonic anhydrase
MFYDISSAAPLRIGVESIGGFEVALSVNGGRSKTYVPHLK